MLMVIIWRCSPGAIECLNYLRRYSAPSGEEVFLDLDGLFYYFTDSTDNCGGDSAGMRRRT